MNKPLKLLTVSAMTIVPLYDSGRIERVTVKFLACLNMFIAVRVRVSSSGI